MILHLIPSFMSLNRICRRNIEQNWNWKWFWCIWVHSPSLYSFTYDDGVLLRFVTYRLFTWEICYPLIVLIQTQKKIFSARQRVPYLARAPNEQHSKYLQQDDWIFWDFWHIESTYRLIIVRKLQHRTEHTSEQCIVWCALCILLIV